MQSKRIGILPEFVPWGAPKGEVHRGGTAASPGHSPVERNAPLSEAAVWSLPLWGRGGGIDKVPLCKVIMGDERQGSLTLPRLFMLPSIQSIPVYGFLFHPTKITSWGKNVQEYGVKTIKSVENKYL